MWWIVLLSAAALYGLHRLCLRLEERGYIYYLRKKPSGSSSAGCLLELQKVLEPQTKHVFQVKEQKPAGGAGGDPVTPRPAT